MVTRRTVSEQTKELSRLHCYQEYLKIKTMTDATTAQLVCSALQVTEIRVTLRVSRTWRSRSQVVP